MAEQRGAPPSDRELRLLKSDLLPEERLLEILDLAAADAELERRLVAAHPLTESELSSLGARARVAAAAVDAAFAPPPTAPGRPHVAIEVPWREIAERLRRFLSAGAEPQLAPAWGVRSATRELQPGEEESILLLREVRHVDGAPAEISATLVRRAERSPGTTRVAIRRLIEVSVFDSAADCGLDGLTVVLTTPFHTTGVATTDADGAATFPIALGGDWLFSEPNPLEGVLRIELGASA